MKDRKAMLVTRTNRRSSTAIQFRHGLVTATTIVLVSALIWLSFAGQVDRKVSAAPMPPPSGTVVAWGAGFTNTSTNFEVSPEFGQSIIPAGLNDVISVVGGGFHTLALKSDGTVVAWGMNTTGQIDVPVGLNHVTAISAGLYHSVALKIDGSVVSWGGNSLGQGNLPPGLTSGVTAISAGRVHTLALKDDGSVLSWIGVGDDFGQANVPSAALSGVNAIAAGAYHSLAVKNDGTVVAWGKNWEGQTNVPSGLSGVTAVAAGDTFSAALKNDGTVVVWGGNLFLTNVPPTATGVNAIAANWDSVQALKGDGTVVAWGGNGYGDSIVPPGLTGVTAIAAGYYHTLALVVPPPPTPTPTPTPTPAADLSITKTDNQTTAAAASLVTYTIVATNNGPNDVVGANVTDNFPLEITNVNWSCIASPGSSCVPGGSGNINASVNLLANGTATFTATGTVTATGGTLTNMASVTHSSVNDPSPQNNNAYDVDEITCPTVVTNTLNSGAGSLRQAMICANAHPGPDTVIFNILTADPGFLGTVFLIQPLSALPPLTDNGTTIDGATQTAFTGDTNTSGPEVVVNGLFTGFSAPEGGGFHIYSGNNHINGLVINRFNNSGIFISGPAAVGNRVTGCYIGTNSTGEDARPNTFDGIAITAFASNNVIGGTTPQARNVISGNTRYGVLLTGLHGNVSNNLIIGNFIGTNASGNAAVGNEMGVVFVSANSNFVGGAGPGAGNLISGNTREGIHSNSSSNQTIQGNYIGTNATGTAAIPNGFLGINIFTGGLPSANNLIGGSVPGAGNLISGNVASGIGIGGNGSDHNVIQGNRIGTDASGNTSISNGGGGIGIGTANNWIGGTSVAERNIISGNGNVGLIIYGDTATGNLVQGNFIGTNATGTARILNNNPDFGGLLIQGAPNNVIGGSAPGSGNLISGNGDFGIRIVGPTGTGNQIQGNLVGTNATGNASVPNRNGVDVLSGGNTIGGPSAAFRNVISGNAGNGLSLRGTGATLNMVLGNYIGTDASGNATLGNIEGFGIIVTGGATGNKIGGIELGDGNVVSGNGSHGIFFRGVGTSNNSIQGNFVGTNAAGSAAIPNLNDGIRFGGGATYNLVGGTVPGARNIISSNLGHGIHIDNLSGTDGIPGLGTGHITVQGNFIGTGVNGISPLGNRLPGVIIFGGSSDNLIGGTTPGAGNVIAFTTGATIDDGAGGFITLPGFGISIANDANAAGDAGGGTSLRNRISQNSIFANNGLGIDLSNLGIMPDPTQGPTANDPCDTDPGANNFQNFPVLTSFSESAGAATIQGTLNGTANTTYTLEFFSGTAGHPSGYGEGQTYLGSITATTDGNCNASFSFTGLLPPGQDFVTATATDPDGNTSEFSAWKPLNADLSISSTNGVNSLVQGSQVTYMISVTNDGPGPVSGAAVTDNFPAKLTNVSWTCSATGGSTCGAAAGSGNINTTVSLAAGGTATFTATVTVAADATGTLENTASVTPPSGPNDPTDPNLANNTATDSDNVTPPNLPPSANAGGPYTGTEGTPIAMSGATAADPDIGDTLSYSWTVNSAACAFDIPATLTPNLTCSTKGSYTATLRVSDGVNPPVTSNASIKVTYRFAGFFQPVDNLPTVNSVNAGQAIPLKFSLGGNKGLNIFAAGYPSSAMITCGLSPTADIEETVTAGGSSLSYDAASDRYIYVWKTDKAWKGTCRVLLVRFNDGGPTQMASFKFK